MRWWDRHPVWPTLLPLAILPARSDASDGYDTSHLLDGVLAVFWFGERYCDLAETHNSFSLPSLSFSRTRLRYRRFLFFSSRYDARENLSGGINLTNPTSMLRLRALGRGESARGWSDSLRSHLFAQAGAWDPSY